MKRINLKNKYINKVVIQYAFITTFVVLLIITNLFFLITENQRESINANKIYEEWYNIYPSKNIIELINFKNPTIHSPDIIAQYRYFTSSNNIMNDYNKVLTDNGWCIFSKNENDKIQYSKNNLICIIECKSQNILEVKLIIKSH